MTCKFSIGSRSQIENFRIVDWLDNFRNTEFHRIFLRLKISSNSTVSGEGLPSLCGCLFGSTPRRPWELRITTIQKPMMSMPSTISAGLYLKSVQTCEKFTDPWSNGVTAEPPTTFDEHPFKLSNLEQWLLH